MPETPHLSPKLVENLLEQAKSNLKKAEKLE
jgi:hypothetical protein